MGQFITLHTADGVALPAWLAEPDQAPRGAVVVLQEIFGVNAHIRDVTERWAALGYLALAPALFTRVQADVNLGYGDADRQAGMALKAATEALPAPGVLPDVQAAIDEAARRSGGRVGLTGFCWGGLWTWRAAALAQGLSAAVAYYGGGMTTPAEIARQPRCPTLAHFGEHDPWIPLDGVLALAQAHPTVGVHRYAADHGFHCDQRAAYDATAAQQAWARTVDFFEHHLRA